MVIWRCLRAMTGPGPSCRLVLPSDRPLLPNSGRYAPVYMHSPVCRQRCWRSPIHPCRFYRGAPDICCVSHVVCARAANSGHPIQCAIPSAGWRLLRGKLLSDVSRSRCQQFGPCAGVLGGGDAIGTAPDPSAGVGHCPGSGPEMSDLPARAGRLCFLSQPEQCHFRADLLTVPHPAAEPRPAGRAPGLLQGPLR